MPEPKQTTEMFPGESLQPLPPSNTQSWVAADKKCRSFRLGNKASVEEVSGSSDPERGVWRWRICEFGGETGVTDKRSTAMRQAEFNLGIGEMPVLLPEVANKKGSRK